MVVVKYVVIMYSTLILLKNEAEAIEAQELLISLGIVWASGETDVVQEDMHSINIFRREYKLWQRILVPSIMFSKNGIFMQKMERFMGDYLDNLMDYNKGCPRTDGHTNKPYENVFTLDEFKEYTKEPLS